MERISDSLSNRIANGSLLAALGVVIVHLPGAVGDGICRDLYWYLSAGLCKAAVPFFFMVSGFFLAAHIAEEGWWRAAVRKRVHSLLVPYVLWSLAFAVLMYAAKPVPIDQWMAIKKWFLLGLDPTNVPLLMPMWYLRMLMLLVLISPLLAKFLHSRHAALFLLSLSFVFFFVFEVSIDLIDNSLSNPYLAAMHRTFSPEALFFFVAGMWLRINGKDMMAVGGCRNSVSPMSFVFSPSASVIHLSIAVGLLCLRRHLPAVWVPLPIIMIFTLLAFWNAVPSGRWPKWLTSLSFPIYLMHYFVTHLMTATFRYRVDDLVLYVAAFFCSVVISGIIAVVLRRFLPRLAMIVFGGR